MLRGMDGELQLFIARLMKEELLDAVTARKLWRLSGFKADILEFGEKVLEHVTEDFERVQALVDETIEAYENGERVDKDPLEDAPANKGKSTAPFHAKPHEAHQHLSRPPFQVPQKSDGPEAEASAPESSNAPSAPQETSFQADAGKRSPLKLASKVVPPAEKTDAPALPEGSMEKADEDAPEDTGEYADLDIDALARMAAESLQTAQASAPKGSKRARVPAGSSVKLKVEINAPDENDTELTVMHKPAEAVISAKGVQPGIPDFSRLTQTETMKQQAAMLGLLAQVMEDGYSDLHLCAGARPYARKHGEIEYLDEAPLPAELARALNTCLLSERQIEYFDRFKDYDFCLALDTDQRFRTNLLQHREGHKGTYRMVPREALSLEELGFGEHAETIRELLAYPNGLILVTGPVGCGKTTTLASLVDVLNADRGDHIITVEDPIEIVHHSRKCSVTQRGVGPHTESYRSALKGALRQDPDIIVIGEMRDLETIEMAISASETGHLVLGTMHTSDASTTLNRLLDVFPPSQQGQIRAMVAESLRGVVCQRLLPATDGGVALACELLLNNSAVGALIRDGRQQGLTNVMETGKREGMVLMDTSILALQKEGRITRDVARRFIRNDMIKGQIEATNPPMPIASAKKKKKKLWG